MKNYFIKYFDSDESLLEFFNNNQSYTIVSILEIKVKGHYKVIYYETKRIRRLLYDIKRCFKSPISKEITDKMRWDFVTYLCTKLPGNISTQSVNYHVLTDNAVLLEYDLYYSSNTRLYICCIATILRDGKINYKFFNQVSEQCF